MTRRPQTLVLALAAITVLTISTAQAALVSISTVTLSADGAELDNSGVLEYAWNTNGNDAGTPTVNGIGFSNTQPADIALVGWPASPQDDPATEALYSGDMKKIMGDMLGTDGAVNGTVTLSDLIVDELYRVQFLHHQQVTSSGIRNMEVHFGTTAGTGGGVIDAGVQGYITTALFTADATSQLFTFRVGGNDRAILNAAVLHSFAIPTPAALPAGLAMLGLGLLRRRSR